MSNRALLPYSPAAHLTAIHIDVASRLQLLALQSWAAAWRQVMWGAELMMGGRTK